MKAFWLSVFHTLVAAGVTYIAVKYPSLIPYIAPAGVALSAIAPSPLTPALTVPASAPITPPAK